MIFDGCEGGNLCAVWEDYNEEDIHRRYQVLDICTIYKIEMMIAAEEDLPIDAMSIYHKGDWKTVSGSEILDCYNKGIDGDYADGESEYGESKSRPPSYCPHPWGCSNWEDDRDMCDKCGGL